MAMRREVVSLSQLLQRRNSVRRDGSISLSQVSSSDSNTRGASSSVSIAAKRAAATPSGSTAPPSTGYGPFKDSRPTRDELPDHGPRQQPRFQPREGMERSSLQGFQNLLSSQLSLSQTDTGAMRFLSQSEDVQEDSWNGYMTSQSQSQTFGSQHPHQARQASIDIAYSQPQPFPRNDMYSRVAHDSDRLSLEAASQRGRDEEEAISRLVAPVTASLNEMKTMLYQQNAQHYERRAADDQVRDDTRSLKNAVESLHDHAKKTKQDCENYHEKIANDAAAAKKEFEAMGARMGAMEKNVESFIANMSRFVREELFALHVEREQSIKKRLPPPSKRAPRPATKRRLMEDTPISRRNARIPTNVTPKPRRTHGAQRNTARDATSARRRSLRIEQLRAKREDKDAVEDEDDDQFGMRFALERVEEARAKRLHQL